MARGGWVRGLNAGRVLRFAVVGGVGTLVNTAALYVLHRLLGVPLVVASVLAVELAVVHNYMVNNRWTFGMRAPSVRRFGKFNVSMLAGLAVNVLVLWALVHGGVHLVVANVVAIGAALAVNYVSSTLWVWGRNRGSS
ncbi:glycosyl transferase family 2 [Streptomyces dysideae]|uniref:Glycosyl transferase family 2 n=1 Tax=Streptomyces dysideae TaxID=909626 RepID=A0A101UBF4_9ACTN|nr:glycosyl transferase family 2 [Streptomyces dysideae]